MLNLIRLVSLSLNAWLLYGGTYSGVTLALPKQVAVVDKKATIGAKLGRSLTRTAHKMEKDMQSLKRKLTRDGKSE